MEIILRSRSKRKKVPVERDHYWYDHINKVMLHGKGGEMRFDNGRPYLVDHEDWQWVNDFDDIVNWVNKTNHVDLVNYANGHYVLIDVEPSHIDEVVYDLKKHDIMFEER